MRARRLLPSLVAVLVLGAGCAHPYEPEWSELPPEVAHCRDPDTGAPMFVVLSVGPGVTTSGTTGCMLILRVDLAGRPLGPPECPQCSWWRWPIGCEGPACAVDSRGSRRAAAGAPGSSA